MLCCLSGANIRAQRQTSKRYPEYITIERKNMNIVAVLLIGALLVCTACSQPANTGRASFEFDPNKEYTVAHASPKRLPYSSSAIRKVELASLRFDTVSSVRWTFEQVWSAAPESGVVRAVIVEKNVLESIDRELKATVERQQNTADRGLNTRLACVVYREDGTTDKLSFDHSSVRYNTAAYELPASLLLLFADYLPETHKASVLNVVQQHQGRVPTRK